ncbi:MAG: GNAT family N-acetyltransferase [Pseudomonadota bacterium]
MHAAENGQLSLQTTAGLVSMQLTSDVQAVAPAWRQMQDAVVCTSGQTFDWAHAWSEHVLLPEARKPLIAVGYGQSGQVEFLLPFETRTVAGLTVLTWLSQEHTNYLFGLFRPDFADRLTKADVSRILNEVGRWADAAVAVLEAQPYSWGDNANPFALLSHQAAPNSGYAVELGDYEALYHSRFKKRARQGLLRKERRLSEAGALEYGWAKSPAEKRDVLEAFFAQKASQFAAMGVTDVFTPSVRAFYQELALLPEDNPSRLHLGFAALDGEILATFSGTVTHGRMNVLLSSLADTPYQRQSPGAQLLRYEIEDACGTGLVYFDLGVGAARHKSEWSNVTYSLFDSFIPLKPQGLALSVPFAARGMVKRAIKSNPQLWALAQKIRRSLGRDTAGQAS